jgi:hypothetical protein
MSAEQETQMLGLEGELAADTGGQRKAEVIAALQDCAREIKRTLDAGVAPAQFAGLQAQMEGFDAAVSVVETIWKRHHPNA